MLNTTRCSALDRLPKKTLLAFLGSKQVKTIPKQTIVTYKKPSGAIKTYKVVSDTDAGLTIKNDEETITVSKMDVVVGTETFIDKLPADSWRVNSFDSKRAEACVTFTTKVNTFVITYIV